MSQTQPLPTSTQPLPTGQPPLLTGTQPLSPDGAPLSKTAPVDVMQAFALAPGQVTHTGPVTRRPGEAPRAVNMDLASPARMAPGAEVIPGYTIKRSIGSGGFGEVFEANAPGDIAKAVKVVHGRLEEQHAERELTSLQRVKEVRHPFVISIERIELADDRLVIVTELADRSLRQRFEECRSDSGGRLPGVPRDELLRYMADAADALDYLYTGHSLQHLDIKPENLLLLSGHIKVADFGLLKDLRDTQVSLMGGVTPVYSPPEVLDGQPDHRSDQYALAIVYQEMLTGQLPFNGRTPGQLAAQHLHSAPNLTPLPTHDRYAIERALSKSPGRRFESCREMVQALRNPPKAALAKSPEVQSQVATKRSTRAAAVRSNSPLLRSETREPEVAAPVEIDPATPARPTILIGIGGLAGESLRRLRRDMVRRFGTAELPSIPLLAIDVDAGAIRDLRTGLEADDADALLPHEVLHTPLRPAGDYRDRKEAYLSWLSRRWLYNVPRSLTTEGMRPLGRLAVIDNIEAVKRRIGELIDDASRENAAAVSAGAAGIPFADQPPQVLLVGSSSGGTSSGAFLDLGYAVTEALAERGIEARPHGLLMQAIAPSDERHDLQMANTTALLGELYHFHQCGYPGDQDFLSPSQVGPVETCTILPCPDGWDSRDDEGHPAELASCYLMQNILGPTATWIDQSRRRDESSVCSLRSVGLSRLGAGRRAAAGEGDALARQVLLRWVDSCRGGASGAVVISDENLEVGSLDGLMASLELDGLRPADVERIDATTEAADELFRHITAGAVHTTREKAFAVLNKAVGVSDSAIPPVQEFRQAIRDRLEAARGDRVRALRRSLFAAVGDRSDGYTIDDVRRRLFATAAALTDRLQVVQHIAQEDRNVCRDLEKGESPVDVALCRRAFRARLHSQVAFLEAEELQTLIAKVLETGRLFDAGLGPMRAVIAMLPPLDPNFAKPLESHRLDRIERRVAQTVEKDLGRYWFMTLSDDGSDELLLAAVRNAITLHLQERSLDEPRAVDPVAAAAPQWQQLAGSIRWVASGPTERAAHIFDDEIQKAYGQKPSAAQIAGDTLLIGEAGDLPLTSVTAAMVESRPDILEIAARLKSRSDVKWCW